MAELTTRCLVVVSLDDEAAAVMLYCCTIVDVSMYDWNESALSFGFVCIREDGFLFLFWVSSEKRVMLSYRFNAGLD